MISCGLDNALQTTGWSIYNNKEKQFLDYGIFLTENTSPIEQRLGCIWKELDNLFTKYNFEFLFFEDCQKQQNAQTYSKLSMVKATILLWCYFNKIPYIALAPSHWRKIIKDTYKVKFGKTRADQKKAAQDFVEQQFQIVANQDICDSIALHVAGIQEVRKNRSAF